MGGFSRFEDIIAWQKAYELTIRIYKLSSAGPFARDFGLRDQIRRAAVSVMANIAEGHGRRTNAEFANFLNLARGSVAEVQSHLYVAKGLHYCDAANFDDLYQIADEVSRMTIALARYLRDSERKGKPNRTTNADTRNHKNIKIQ